MSAKFYQHYEVLVCCYHLQNPSFDDELWKIKRDTIEEKRRVSFDARTRTLKPLNVGEDVRIQNLVSKRFDTFGRIVKVG